MDQQPSVNYEPSVFLVSMASSLSAAIYVQEAAYVEIHIPMRREAPPS